MTKMLVGTSGWMYKHWGSVFYPDNVKGKAQLPYFANHFDTVEINSTFYHIPPGSGVKGWYDSTPAGFKFAIKLNRYQTHRKRLIIDDDSKELLDAFTKAIQPVADKTAAILVQIPPSFKANFERLDTFFTHLMKQKYYRERDVCFEPRHDSWYEGNELEKVLKKHNIGLVIPTYPGKFKPPYLITGSVVYIRFHATAENPGYPVKDLDAWADYVKHLPEGVKRIYVYFNNDFEGCAIENAQYFIQKLASFHR